MNGLVFLDTIFNYNIRAASQLMVGGDDMSINVHYMEKC